MRSIISLVNKLQQDFPELHFTLGETFAWLPEEKTVLYIATDNALSALLHEVAHAALGHQDYARDVTLLSMERAAWEHAREKLSVRYGVEITEEAIEDALDSYRDWLHARSACPECGATGLQGKHRTYKCLACHTKWHVNEARMCALRRYTLT